MGRRSSKNRKCITAGCSLGAFGTICLSALLSPDFLLQIVNTFSSTLINKNNLSEETVLVFQGLTAASYGMGFLLLLMSREGKKLRKMVFS